MLTLITCFHGRHDCVERIIRCFLNQELSEAFVLLLYNNSRVPQQLDNIPLPNNKHIILVNNNIDLVTGKEYDNVGDIFRDAITFVPEGTTVINFFDSDDIFLPQHAQEGVKGFTMATEMGFLAYKPYYSYYIHDDNQVDLCYNNMEPSIFVSLEHVKTVGFNSVNSSYHQKWLNPIQRDKLIWEPKEGLSTFLYCWEKGHNTHKISGLGDDKENFAAHRRFEVDHGDGVLSPARQSDVQKYYDLIKTNETITCD